MRYRLVITCLLFAFASLLYSQSSGIPLHAPSYQIIDRTEILSGMESQIHPELKFFPRSDAAEYALKLDTINFLSRREREDIQYLLNDNNDCLPDTSHCYIRNHKKLLKAFYRSPANLFEVNTKDFSLRVNPMFNFEIGQQQGDADLVFVNQRGLEVRGEVDHKVFFYTNLVESQARYPDYVRNWEQQFNALPGSGQYKTYTPRFPSVRNAYDFNTATAYLGFNVTKHIGIQLGHGKHFIGNGYRSLLLSDVGNQTFYLKLNTRVWKFHYQNLFLELSPTGIKDSAPNERIPKKYAAIHYLNYKITSKLAIGLFEATIFNRSRQFEFQYLNPVILYRTVEGMIGSPDNVLIGFDGHWNLFRHIQLYGQVLIDEFIYSALVNPAEKGWWGNKFGTQAGLKYMNVFGVDHLDLQLEWNRVRPYTYSHYDSLNSYTHYNQPLAHSLWSNFNEFIGIARYQPLSRLWINARLIHAKTGDNTPTQNWGSNPLLGYGTRVMDYGNTLGQGIGARLDIYGLDATWMLYHNLFVDLKFLYRRKNSEDDALDLNTKVYSLGLRMNIWNQNLDF